jgi:tetratricopeptide (TPR) repeat protein
MPGEPSIRARSMVRSAARLVGALVLATLVHACTRPPAPPDPATLGDIDAEVRALIEEHTAAVHASPSDPARWGQLGLAYEANGLLVEAAQAYDIAIGLDDAEPRWRYRRALLLARRGDVGPALADLDRVIQLAPAYAPARWRQGFWRLDLGETDRALESFRAAMQAAPDDPAGPVGVALVHLSRREDAEAAAALERLLEQAPGNRYALHLLGTAYQRLGREDDARFALSIGTTGQPAWTDPWSDEVDRYRRGFAAMLKEATRLGLDREFDKAIALLEQLRGLRPEDMALKVYLGGMYASAGRMREAESLLMPILQADPRQFDAHMHLASGYLFTGALDTAAVYAARAIEIRPGSADASRLQGIVLWRRGQDREAMAAFQSAATADPRDAMPHLWMGMMLGQQGRYVEARQRFESALARNPLLGDALLGVADTYAAVGSFEQAQRYLERAAQAEPGNPRLAAARQRIEAATKGRR